MLVPFFTNIDYYYSTGTNLPSMSIVAIFFPILCSLLDYNSFLQLHYFFMSTLLYITDIYTFK